MVPRMTESQMAEAFLAEKQSFPYMTESQLAESQLAESQLAEF